MLGVHYRIVKPVQPPAGGAVPAETDPFHAPTGQLPYLH